MTQDTSPETQSDDSYHVVLVEIVNFSRSLLRRLLSNPALLSGIDDRKFEELVAALLFDLGLQEVELTPLRKDGGRDIIATHVESSGHRLRLLIECKHWVSGNKVTMKWAVSLLAVSKGEGASAAILLSSSGFGPKLVEQEANLKKQGLFLKGSEDLHKWISIWERQYGSILLQPVDPRLLLNLDI